TAPALESRLAMLGASLLVETLEGLETGKIIPEPQSDADATYAPILKKEDGRIDWAWPANRIANQVRGFLLWPGAYTTFNSQQLRIWSAKADDRYVGAPGSLQVKDHTLRVACGEGTSVQIEELQLEGRKKIRASDFVNGRRLTADDILGEKTN
ncbi:MAG: methionyl-tRNA formyltransferase, partial [Bryobacteraceae bacterium]